MSTCYMPIEKISFADLFDGRLERFEVREHVTEGEMSDTERCLTDGRNYLWVYSGSDGALSLIKRYGFNAPGRILGAIAEIFDTDIFSEYEPQYWGFDTQEEWDQTEKKFAEKHEVEFHAEIIEFVTGGPNKFRAGTVGMIMAEIAKGLVAENSGLLSLDKKAELMEAIYQAFRADHVVTVKLDDQAIAAVRMAMTHENDLPEA